MFKAKAVKGTVCPACKVATLQEPKVMNSLSRYNKSVYICNACGTREALEGDFWTTPYADLECEACGLPRRAFIAQTPMPVCGNRRCAKFKVEVS